MFWRQGGVVVILCAVCRVIRDLLPCFCLNGTRAAKVFYGPEKVERWESVVSGFRNSPPARLAQRSRILKINTTQARGTQITRGLASMTRLSSAHAALRLVPSNAFLWHKHNQAYHTLITKFPAHLHPQNSPLPLFRLPRPHFCNLPLQLLLLRP